jgi:hypothetical protein
MKMNGKALRVLMMLAMVVVLAAGCGGGGGGVDGGSLASDTGSIGPADNPVPGDGAQDPNDPGDNEDVNVPPVANAGTGQTVAVNTLVTVNGSQSYDIDEDYPLIFSWHLQARPDGSDAELTTHADGQLASFVADREGDYEIALTVTDQRGAESAPAMVTISTINSAPVADAGPNQSFTEPGTAVSLDGSLSYDPDGDAITYAWVVTSKPDGSAAQLDDETTAAPGFVADLLGTYMIELVVSDVHGAVSDAALVIVTSENIPPVAHAGNNAVVFVGDTVSLDGSGSFDANEDPLTYQWSISVKPLESEAELTGADQINSSFVADLQGLYTVSLVVSDGLDSSDPHAVDILAVDVDFVDDFFISSLMDAVERINALPDDAFFNGNSSHRSELTGKIIAVLVNFLESAAVEDLVDYLLNDIGNKMDGCPSIGGSTAQDWIIDCDAQEDIYPLIKDAAEYLQSTIPS